MNNTQTKFTQLKTSRLRALAIARAKLEQAWWEQGGTDAEVLATGAEFDALLNRYQRMKRNESESESKVKCPMSKSYATRVKWDIYRIFLGPKFRK